MSQWIKSALAALEAVERNFRRTQFFYSGVPLGADDNRKIASLYTCWLAILMEDSTLRFRSRPLAIGRITRNLQEKDVEIILTSCKEAYTLIVQSVEIGYPSNYADFKHLLRRNGTDVSLIGDFKGLIVQVLAEPTSADLRTLMTWLLWPTKVNLTLEKLEKKAIEAYSQQEADMADDIALTPEEKHVLTTWFPKSARPYLYSVMAGHHGSGSTAFEGYGSISQKYRERMRTDALLDYVVRKVDADWSKRWYVQPGLCRKTETTFVPKSFSSYRTIAMEQASLMFWQEALFEAVTDKAIAKQLNCEFPFADFARIYSPSTQEPNRRAAMRGSVDGSIATIDLHAASDSVRLSHVKQWFRDTCLYEWLIATRSPETVLPTGEEIHLKKYGSMGNATTFLVETATFAAITECAIRGKGGDPHKVKWGVYGDDIYVETRYCHEVIDRLQKNGFIVNSDKTLLYGATGFFRESCGVFAFDGEDVTPLRCSRKFDDLQLVNILSKQDFPLYPAAIAEAIDLCNQCFMHGYKILRAQIIGHLLRLPQRFRPPFGLTDGALWSCQPSNTHLKWYWNVGTQSWDVRHGLVQMKRPKKTDPEVNFEEFLRITRFRGQDAEPVLVDSTARRGSTCWSSKRTPVFLFSDGFSAWDNPSRESSK